MTTRAVLWTLFSIYLGRVVAARCAAADFVSDLTERR